jgi:Ca2+-binding RTX toxin-like protein
LNNTLTGGPGDDLLNGGAGNDLLVGGANNDSYIFVPATVAEADQVTENLNEGIDTLNFAFLTTNIVLNLGSTSIQPVHLRRTLKLNSSVVFENLIGGAGADTLFGNTLNNTLTGNAGDDKLLGAAGNDLMLGGANNDTYMFVPTSTAEADQVTENTNEGTDTLNFAYLTTSVVLNLGSTSIQTVHTNRTLRLNSLSTFENAVGGTGSDTLLGNALANRLSGGDGNNILVGMEAGDVLESGSGRDILIGGVGPDFLNGGTGDDILIAGRTTNDTSLSNLNTLRTQWISGNAYATRIANLRAGVGSPVVSLKAKTNVLNDTAAVDRLTGGGGTDWYLRALDDLITDLLAGESIDLL